MNNSNVKNYKTELYTISEDSVIQFYDEDSGDRVDVLFVFKDGETGIYSQEYKINVGDYSKKADITCGVIDSNKKCIRWKVYEVKSSFTGEHLIFKAFQQLEAGYYYLYKSVLRNYSFSNGNIGIITSRYVESNIKNIIKDYETTIGNIDKNTSLPIGMKKIKPEIGKLQQRMYIMNCLLERRFIHPITKDELVIDIRIMNSNDGNNTGHLEA